jgi:hypothetical protein
VLDNIDRYSAMSQDPLVIYLVICPETTVTTAALEKLQRNSLPQRMGTNTPVENVLVVNKMELKCLLKYQPAVADKSTKFVKLNKPYC